MEVFGLRITDEELGHALARSYQEELIVRSCNIEIHSDFPPRRLAKVDIHVQTAQGLKQLEILVKEGSRHELVAISLANKVLPYSSPKVILYKFFPNGAWIFLENFSTWVDVGGKERTYERMLDGLYTIHRVFLDRTDALTSNFNAFPTVSGEQLRASINRTLNDLDELRGNHIVSGLFVDWRAIREKIDERLSNVKVLSFPMTLLHGSYYPNTVRGLIDSENRFHVVAYDWQYCGIGWPQIDLALLLDRLDVISRSRNQKEPSPVLLGRYWMQLGEDFRDLEYTQFRDVYEFCYLYRALSLVRWWLKGFIASPIKEPGRAVLEVETKFDRILGRDKDE
jgi:hypothetical protein